MRLVKIVGLLLVGAVVGGAVTGYVVKLPGAGGHLWASLQYDEAKASDALMTLGSLKTLHAGDIDATRRGLEERLISQALELAGIKKSGHDPNGDISRTLARIHEYRQANPWSGGNKELDKMAADALSSAADAAGQARPSGG
jgi:hypothetical protein